MSDSEEFFLSPQDKVGTKLAGGRQPGFHAQLKSNAAGGLLLEFDDQDGEELSAIDVDIEIDGRAWSRLPAIKATSSSPFWQVLFHAPPQPSVSIIHVLCRNVASREVIISTELRDVAPVVNRLGLPASSVFDIAATPLFSLPWLEFDGSNLIISGAHLPPAGNPSRLQIEFPEGVAGSVDYPLASPEFGTHYWYWPNAHFSGIRIKIDLAQSVYGSEPFTFRFVTTNAGPAKPGMAPQSHTTAIWADRNRVWVPSSLHDFVGYPADGNQLSRVQTWSTARTVTFTGFNAFKGFESLARKHDLSLDGNVNILDWGCGHGRLTRHFISNYNEANVFGVDVDEENIAWCQRHLSGGEFLVGSLWPPSKFQSKSMDLIIGLSVMTHLTAAAQQAWLEEIGRLLKPNGLALISFGGEAAAAFASMHHDKKWWSKWRQTGFDDQQRDPALAGKVANDDYYRVTHQSVTHTRAVWQRSVDLVGIVEQAFGYQDIAVLRSRGE